MVEVTVGLPSIGVTVFASRAATRRASSAGASLTGASFAGAGLAGAGLAGAGLGAAFWGWVFFFRLGSNFHGYFSDFLNWCRRWCRNIHDQFFFRFLNHI